MTTALTAISEATLESLSQRLMEIGFDAQETLTVLESVRRGCVREVVTLTVLRRLPALFSIESPAAPEQIDFELLTQLFHPDDRSDFLPQLRAIKLLDECTEEQLADFCRRINTSLATYQAAKPLIAKLLSILQQLSIALNKENAGRLEITTCFVLAYPEWLLYRTFSFSDLEENIFQRKVTIRFDQVAWLQDCREDLVFVSRRTPASRGKKQQAIEVSALSFEEFSQIFGDRVTVSFSNFNSNFDYHFDKVVADKHYSFDGRELAKREAPAPRCQEYTAYIAQMISECESRVALEVSEHNNQLITSLSRAAEQSALLGLKVPTLSKERYRQWLIQQLSGACSKAEVVAKANQLKLTWNILAQLSDTPHLESLVAQVTKMLPRDLTIGGERVQPRYVRDRADGLVPKIVIRGESLDSADDQDLPTEWQGLNVQIDCPRASFLRTLRLTANGEFFNNLRRQLTAKTEGVDSTNLPKAQYNLLKAVTVKHRVNGKNSQEVIYVVAGSSTPYFTAKPVALKVAHEKLKELIPDYIATVLERKKLTIHSSIVRILANMALGRVKDDLSNLSELPDFISNFIVEKFEFGKTKAKVMVKEFQDIIAQLKAIGENGLAGRCMTLQAYAEDELAARSFARAEVHLAEARKVLASVPPPKKRK